MLKLLGMHVFMYTYTYMRAYVFIYIYIHMCGFVCIYKHLCVHVNIWQGADTPCFQQTPLAAGSPCMQQTKNSNALLIAFGSRITFV